MGLIVPNSAEKTLLEMLLNITSPTNPQLKLYCNDVTLDGDTIISDFTECPSGTGYAAKTLSPGNWTITTNAVERAQAEYNSEQEFTFSVAQDIYGYYVTNAAGTDLLWAQEAAYSPVELPSGGGSFVVHPRITLYSENNA